MKYLGILTILLTAYSPAFADMELAEKSYREKDYVTAFNNYLPEAQNGSARAQFQLGILFATGMGTKKNLIKAEKWLLKANNNENPYASFYLGVLYHDGISGTPDYEKSKHFLEIATKGKFVGAFDLLIDMTYHGRANLQPNLTAARNWLERLLAIDNMTTKRTQTYKEMLVRMYFKGIGGPKDYMKLLPLCSELALLPNYSAQSILATVFLDKDSPYRDETKSLTWYYLTQMNGYNKISQDVLEFDKSAPHRTKIDAMNKAASLFRQSAKTAKFNTKNDESSTLFMQVSQHILNYDNAIKWLEKAVEKGSSYSAAALFDVYYNGEVIDQDMEKAIYYSTLVDIVAPKVPILKKRNYGQLKYATYEKIKDKAEKWTKININLFPDERSQKSITKNQSSTIRENHSISSNVSTGPEPERNKIQTKTSDDAVENLFNLGKKLHLGEGVTRNNSEALAYLLKASKTGHANAAYLAGNIYTNDKELENFSKADEQYRIAINNSLLKAALPLGQLYTNQKYARINIKLAVTYLEIAANNPIGGKEAGDAANFLAQIYRGKSPGITPSEKVAIQWLEIAAENGNKEAAAEMGSKYLIGNSVAKNYHKAFRYTETAAKLGHAASQFNLGIMYYEGRTVKKNLVTALTWFMVAKSTDPATDNGTIEKFTRSLHKSQTKQAEQEANKITNSLNHL